MSPAAAGVDNSPEALRRDVLEKLFCDLGKFPAIATPTDDYLAPAHVVRDRLMHRWISTARTYFQCASRTVVYLSAEFLMGPQLDNNLINLEIRHPVRQAVASLGFRLDELLAHEPEPGLGNGGLGRLAACYMDSLATLQIPALGYGIRYEFGIFEQAIRDGWQIERTDKWRPFGNAWEIVKPETAYQVPFGGRTETVADPTGRVRVRWIPDRVVVGTAYDTPVLGYAVNTANTLRLWSAQASESFDYPNDGPEVGAGRFSSDRAVDEYCREIWRVGPVPIDLA